MGVIGNSGTRGSNVFCRRVGSHAAALAPQADVEAVAEAPAEVAANPGEPRGAVIEIGGVAAGGHEQDALVRNAETAAERLDFRDVGGVGDDEFEPGLGRTREEAKGVGLDAQGFGDTGIGELG